MAAPAVAASQAWDVVVVGASFSGLAFASTAAARGARVLVLERDPAIGAVVRTTGVLFSDVLDVLDVPQPYLLNAVRRIQLRAPGQAPITVGGRAWRFYMADVPGMLRWMAATAEAHGASIRCGATFSEAQRAPDGAMRVVYLQANGAEADVARPAPVAVRARMLVGADGAHSSVARSLGLERNRRFLAGAEWLVEGVPLDGETFYLVMDHALAPGYCAWLAPHGNLAALGVAGHQRAFKPHVTLDQAAAIFADVADLGAMRVRERKGGVIPVGGRLRHVYRDDAAGHALLLGDAAGLCGAATGGGIYPALVAARLAGQAVAQEVLDGTPGAVRAYLRDLPQAGRLGHYLKIEDWIRLVMDHMRSNADVRAFYGLFGTAEGRQVLQRTLFETPIISMDSSFFGLVRSLLGKSPFLYGSALRAAWLRAAWQRVLPRAGHGTASG